MAAKEEKEIITESDLRKTLARLEGKKEEEPKKVDPKIVTAELRKASEVVAEGASQPLRKAIEASTVLNEFCSLIGLHIDEALDVLGKSVQESAERDYSLIKVLEKFGAQIESMQKMVEKFGAQPGPSKVTQPVTSKPTEILRKAGEEGKGEGDVDAGSLSKKQIVSALEELGKEAKGQEQNELIVATATFESTGKISDETLHKAVRRIKEGRAA
jgi:hypothetical protein